MNYKKIFQKKYVTVLIIIVFLYFIYLFYYQMEQTLMEQNSKNYIHYFQTLSNYGKLEIILNMIGLFMAIALLPIIPLPLPIFSAAFIIITYFLLRNMDKSLIEESSKYKSIKKILYYRDDLSKISPAVLSYVMNFQVELERDIPAHILKLILKRYVKEENGKLKTLKKSQDALTRSDKLILKMIDEKFYGKNNIMRYEFEIRKEAIEEEYIIPKEFSRKKIRKKIIQSIIFIVGVIIGLIFLSNIDKSQDEVDFSLFIVVIMVYIPILIMAIVFYLVQYYKLYKQYDFVRTKKGNKLLDKAYGLKKFMKDFSKVNQREKKELKLWEYYLIYAIIFELNDNIHDKMLDNIMRENFKK